MPCLTNIVHNSAAIIDVVIMPYQIQKSKTDPNKEKFTPMPGKQYKALIDTGADITCITNRVVSQLKMKRTGNRRYNAASGSALQKTYSFFVNIPIGNTPTPVNFVEEGGEVQFGTSSIDVLLGMDVIMKGSLKIDPDGHFSFCI